jgi:hypothetical protein
MARELVVADAKKRVSAAAWARYEQVGLAPELELDELVLNWTDRRIADLEAKGALVSLNIDRTIEGGSTVTMTLADPEQRILSQRAGRTTTPRITGAAARAAYRAHPTEVDEAWEPIVAPNVIGRAMEVELDGVTFRLVKVRYSSATQQIDLTFEDRIIYWLKRKRGERRASRASCTRAEFVLALLREIKARNYRFVCPELHVPQPIDGSKGGGSTTSGAVLHVGDSLAVGTIPYESAELGKGKVTGDGKVGRTSSETLTVLNNRLGSKYAVVVFDAGTNDDPTKPAALRANLDAAKAKVGARTLIVATLNRGNADVTAMNATIKDFATQSGVELVDWGVKGDPYLSGDGTHPTTDGYKYRGKLFADAARASSSSALRSSSVVRRTRLAPTALAASSASSVSSADAEQGGGFPASVSFTVKGAKATPDQVRNLDGVLTECAAQGCSNDVMIATVCCVIQESVAQRVRHGDAAGPDSRGLFQQRAPWGPESVRLDPRGSTRMFLTGGRGGQKGYKQVHGSLKTVPGGIENAVKRVQISVGGYAQHETEARKIVGAWGGAGTAEGAASSGGTYTKSYQFARNKDESSWDAMKRLGDEVGWRVFVVGNSVYYMSEVDLYGRRARYEVTPDDPAILDLSYDVDWGKASSELSLEVVLDRWGAPPGTVVLVDGFGVPDGRWLIVNVSRDYFSPTATVTLRQPGKEKLEPASETTTRASNAASSGGSSGTSVDDGSKSGKFYAEAKRISDAGGPYVYGGGHGPSLSSLNSGQGLDCSSSTSLALKRAGLYDENVAHVSGWFATSYGQPGKGEKFTVWANAGHVWTQFHGLGNAWRFDTSPYGSGGRGPRLRTTPRPTDGFTPRHWPGC